MHCNTSQYSSPSSTSPAPPTGMMSDTNKAEAPDGKWYTFSHRQKLDRNAMTKAVLDVKKLRPFQEASREEQMEMCLRAERDEEERRKGKGRHVSCLFDEKGVPLTTPAPAVKTLKGRTRYRFERTAYGVEDHTGLKQLEEGKEESENDDDGDESLRGSEVSSDEQEESESEDEEADDSDDSDEDTGPAVAAARSYAYPDNSLYYIYLPDSRRLDWLEVSVASDSRASLPSCPPAAMTARVDMCVGRALGYSETDPVYHMYLPGGRRLDALRTGMRSKNLYGALTHD